MKKFTRKKFLRLFHPALIVTGALALLLAGSQAFSSAEPSVRSQRSTGEFTPNTIIIPNPPTENRVGDSFSRFSSQDPQITSILKLPRSHEYLFRNVQNTVGSVAQCWESMSRKGSDGKSLCDRDEVKPHCAQNPSPQFQSCVLSLRDAYPQASCVAHAARCVSARPDFALCVTRVGGALRLSAERAEVFCKPESAPIEDVIHIVQKTGVNGDLLVDIEPRKISHLRYCLNKSDLESQEAAANTLNQCYMSLGATRPLLEVRAKPISAPEPARTAPAGAKDQVVTQFYIPPARDEQEAARAPMVRPRGEGMASSNPSTGAVVMRERGRSVIYEIPASMRGTLIENALSVIVSKLAATEGSEPQTILVPVCGVDGRCTRVDSKSRFDIVCSDRSSGDVRTSRMGVFKLTAKDTTTGETASSEVNVAITAFDPAKGRAEYLEGLKRHKFCR